MQLPLLSRFEGRPSLRTSYLYGPKEAIPSLIALTTFLVAVM